MNTPTQPLRYSPLRSSTFKCVCLCFIELGWRICITAPTQVTARKREREMDRREMVDNSIDLEDGPSHQPTLNRGSFIFTSSCIRRYDAKVWNILWGEWERWSQRMSHLDKIWTSLCEDALLPRLRKNKKGNTNLLEAFE